MRPFLTATIVLCTALAGCDAADRAALAGGKAPTSIATAAPTPPPAPTPVDAALLFPPASPADAPRLTRVSTAPRHIAYAHHRRAVHVAARRSYARVHSATRVEQTVTRPAYGDLAYDRQIRRRIETSGYERRSSFSEGYDLADVRTERAPAAAGRDRDGFLTWPGKIPDRR